jgi:hypothetical protein
MPQICSICRHEKRDEIEKAIFGGEPLRKIAKHYGASPAAVFRHKRAHLSTALLQSKRAADEIKANTLFDRLRAINRETEAILAQARRSENQAVALHAIARLEKQLEFEARFLASLSASDKAAMGIGVRPDVSEEAIALAELFTVEELERAQERMKVIQSRLQ